MDSKGQGGLEYLLMVGGAIFVSTIIIGIIVSTVGNLSVGAGIKCKFNTTFGSCNSIEGCLPLTREFLPAFGPLDFFICSEGSGVPQSSVFFIPVGFAPNVESTTLSLSFSESSDVTAIRKPLASIAVSGYFVLNSFSSYARVIAETESGDELLVFGSDNIFFSTGKFDFSGKCDETCFLEDVSIKKIKVEVEGATVFIEKLESVESGNVSQATKNTLKAGKARAFAAQISEKISKISENIRNKDLAWTAGETTVSKMTFAEKKKLFGGKLPNLQGFEAYTGGVFALAEISGEATGASAGGAFPASFDWRNRHGENWMTPVRDQSNCGSCWAFGTVGATEGTINVYYNQHLNLNLSEQDLVSCCDACSLDLGCSGGWPDIALDWISSTGTPDEACFPYTGTNNNCANKCSDWQSRVWRIGGKTIVSPSINVLKEAFIEHGSLSMTNWPWLHVITAVGYGTDANTGKFYVIFKNSWGTGWGESGYGNTYITEDSLADKTYEFYAVDPFFTPPAGTTVNVLCVDRDNDNYCNWGIGPRPDSCPEACVAAEDFDDSDPSITEVVSPSEVCNNGTDDDYDSLVDCADASDCIEGAYCDAAGKMVCSSDGCILKGIDLNGCSALDQNGKEYWLTADIIGANPAGSCITIIAPGVTLNCKGHKIYVSSGRKISRNNHNLGMVGVYSDQPYTTVKGCNFVSSPTAHGGGGLVLDYATDSNVYGNTFTGLLSALRAYAFFSSSATIQSNEFYSNEKAVIFSNANDNNVFGNFFYDNNNSVVLLDSKRNSISRNIIEQSNDRAIVITSYSRDNEIVDNSIAASDSARQYFMGIVLSQYASGNKVTNNTLNGFPWGIRIDTESTGNEIVGNTVIGDTDLVEVGIAVGSRNNILRSNTLLDNWEGISIAANSTIVEDNNSCGSKDVDLECTDSPLDKFYGTTGSGNRFTKVDACIDGWPTMANYSDCNAPAFEEISIGNNAIKYTDGDGVVRKIPFAINLPTAPGSTITEQTFAVDNQIFYARCIKPASGLLVNTKANDLLNGNSVYIYDGSKLRTDRGDVDLSTLSPGEKLYLNAMQFDFQSAYSIGINDFNISLWVDGYCEFSRQSFSATPDHLTINDKPYLNNKLYFDDDYAARGPLWYPLDVKNSSMKDTYKYRVHLGLNSGKIYLVLSYAFRHKTYNGNGINVWGTDTTENGYADVPYYMPDTTDFVGGNASDYTYFVAMFALDEDGNYQSVKPFIDTATGKTIALPNSRLSYYNGCVYYRTKTGATEILACNANSNSATTGHGSKITVRGGIAKTLVPITKTTA